MIAMSSALIRTLLKDDYQTEHFVFAVTTSCMTDGFSVVMLTYIFESAFQPGKVKNGFFVRKFTEHCT